MSGYLIGMDAPGVLGGDSGFECPRCGAALLLDLTDGDPRMSCEPCDQAWSYALGHLVLVSSEFVHPT